MVEGLKGQFWSATVADGRLVDVPLTRSAKGSAMKPAYYIQGSLPDFEALPEPIQALLNGIQALSEQQQMGMVHKFVRENMVYPTNPDDIHKNDSIVSNADVIKSWQYGDCDNQAQLTACLLRYRGFDPKDMAFVVAETDYQQDGRGPSSHAVLVVKGDKQHYMLDMNCSGLASVAPDQQGGLLASFWDAEGRVAYATLDPLWIVPVEAGAQAYLDNAYIERVSEHYNFALKAEAVAALIR